MDAAYSVVGNAEMRAVDHAVAAIHSDDQRVLDTLHDVERFAGRAGRRREHEWLTELRTAVEALEKALTVHHHHASSGDGLLTRLGDEGPDLHARVTELRERFGSVRSEVHAFARRLEGLATSRHIDVTDLRRRVERTADELRYQQAREADLFHEARLVDLTTAG